MNGWQRRPNGGMIAKETWADPGLHQGRRFAVQAICSPMHHWSGLHLADAPWCHARGTGSVNPAVTPWCIGLELTAPVPSR